MARKNNEYDWLNDPFDEKKIAQDREQARMSGSSKAAIGCGCLVAVLAVLVIIVLGGVQYLAFATA